MKKCLVWRVRSSHSEEFYEKAVQKHLAKFTRPILDLFNIKFQVLTINKTDSSYFLKFFSLVAFVQSRQQKPRQWCNSGVFAMSLQGRSQDLNGSLQEILLNFDNNVIIMVRTSSSWHWWHKGKTWKVLSIVQSR